MKLISATASGDDSLKAMWSHGKLAFFDADPVALFIPDGVRPEKL